MPGGWVREGLQEPLARQGPEPLLFGKITKKTQRGQGSNCGKEVPWSPRAVRSGGEEGLLLGLGPSAWAWSQVPPSQPRF